MKIARFFSGILGCLGLVLLLGSMGLCLFSRNAPVRVLEMPAGAESCSEGFARGLNEGDLAAAAGYLYGRPDLGVDAAPQTPESALLWDAFRSSIDFEYTGPCYVSGSELARSAVITTLDVAAVTERLPQLTRDLVNQRVIEAEELSEIYDSSNQFREELVEQILQEALQQALTREAATVTREVTVTLIRQDGAWWAVADSALLEALAAGA